MGRLASSSDAEHWLCSRAKTQPLWIIRCPLHISEWALRQCEAGRTTVMRAKARWGREEWAKNRVLPSDPILEPFPPSFKGAAG